MSGHVGSCLILLVLIPDRTKYNREMDEEQMAEEWEKENLVDWNVIMKDVTDGAPGKDINATLIKDLLYKHYKDLKESNV